MSNNWVIMLHQGHNIVGSAGWFVVRFMSIHPESVDGHNAKLTGFPWRSQTMYDLFFSGGLMERGLSGLPFAPSHTSRYFITSSLDHSHWTWRLPQKSAMLMRALVDALMLLNVLWMAAEVMLSTCGCHEETPACAQSFVYRSTYKLGANVANWLICNLVFLFPTTFCCFSFPSLSNKYLPLPKKCLKLIAHLFTSYISLLSPLHLLCTLLYYLCLYH